MSAGSGGGRGAAGGGRGRDGAAGGGVARGDAAGGGAASSGGGGATSGGAIDGRAGAVPLFREETPAPGWLRVVGVLALVAAVLLIVDSTVIDPGSFQGGGAIAAVIAAIVLLALGILALTVRIVVTVEAAAPGGASASAARVKDSAGATGSTGSTDSARATSATGSAGAMVAALTVTLALSPVWRVSFARSDVDSAKKVEMLARDFGGAGYRVLPGNKRGLLFTSGPGVTLVRRSNGRSYTVRSERPDDLIAALYRR
ncbi:MAG: hypothetical protein JWQ64_1884 [Subtercola sp.]|nr:hypothetical protein [Subtercola sp.]